MPEDYNVKLSFTTVSETVSLREVNGRCEIDKQTTNGKSEVTKDALSLAGNIDCDIVYPPNFRGSGTHKPPTPCPACNDPIWLKRSQEIQCTLRLPCFPRDQMPRPCTGTCENKSFPCNVCEDGPKAHTQDDATIGNRLMGELSKLCEMKLQGQSDSLNIPIARIKIKQKSLRIKITSEATVKFLDNKLTPISTISKTLVGFAKTDQTELSFDVKPVILNGFSDWRKINPDRRVTPVVRGGRGSVVWLNPGNQGASTRLSIICPEIKDVSWLYGFDNFSWRVRQDGANKFITFDQRTPLSIQDLLPQGSMNLSTLANKCKQTSSISNWPPNYVNIPIANNLTPEQIKTLADNAGGRDKPLEQFCNKDKDAAGEVKAALQAAQAKYEAAVQAFLATKGPADACAVEFSVPAPTVSIE